MCLERDLPRLRELRPPPELEGDEIDEVRRDPRVVDGRLRQWPGDGPPGDRRLDQPRLLHGEDDAVPVLLVSRGEHPIRRADRARQPGRLVDVEGGHILAEKVARGGG